MSVKKAVILAGGKGKRLAPYTTVLPKPLLPVGDLPILEIVVRQLAKHQITDLTFCVGYLGSLLEAYFGDGSRLGVKIKYSYEQEPLGTAGPLALVKGLDSPFLVMNGDLLTTFNYSRFFDVHQKNNGIATLGLARKKVQIDLGVIETLANGEVSNYIEKPSLEYRVSMGIYIFDPRVLTHIQGKLDLPDLVLKLKNSGNPVMTFDEPCEWLDIGRPEDYQLATEEFEKKRSLFL